jgi:hypothetical protein
MFSNNTFDVFDDLVHMAFRRFLIGHSSMVQIIQCHYLLKLYLAI